MRASAARFGVGMTEIDPWNIAPLYCASMGALPDCGPRGFGSPVSPLPSSTNSRRPSRSNSTLVGYQPTGIQPSTLDLPGADTSATVTVLLSAFATSSVFPSGDNARPFGVDPAGASAPNATEICSEAVLRATSTTQTAFVFAHATNR